MDGSTDGAGKAIGLFLFIMVVVVVLEGTLELVVASIFVVFFLVEADLRVSLGEAEGLVDATLDEDGRLVVHLSPLLLERRGLVNEVAFFRQIGVRLGEPACCDVLRSCHVLVLLSHGQGHCVAQHEQEGGDSIEVCSHWKER